MTEQLQAQPPMMTLVRGLPGSGKSTLAQQLAADTGAVVCEADQFFTRDGVYAFDPAQLGAAHAWCQAKANTVMRTTTLPVVVANTFSQQWELEPYLKMAEAAGYQVQVVDVFDAGLTDEELVARNVHQVPVGVVAKMRRRWQEADRWAVMTTA